MADKGKDKGADAAADVDVLLKGLMAQPGVDGVLIYNDLGIPLKWTPGAFGKAPPTSSSAGSGGGTTIPPAVTAVTAGMSELVKCSRQVAAKLLGEADTVQMLRLRTTAAELIVTPAPDGSCTMVVNQTARSQVGGGAGAAAAAGQ